MDESLKLSINQRQQQTLSPMQLQFVRVLEMTGPEAEDEVRRALDENPALEADTSGEHVADADDYNESAEQLQLADYRSEDDIPFYRLEARNRAADEPYYEPLAVERGESVMDYLMGQLAQNAAITDNDMEIARYITGNIDDNGYMTRTLRALTDDMAIQWGLEADESDVRRVWDAVRSLDPPGIGAVDLRDSLLLQLQRRPATDDTRLATEIIRDYFDLFSLMHFDRLRSLTGADVESMRRAVDIIKSLNPKPGALIGGQEDDRVRHITPDFLVEADGDDLTLTSLSRIPHLQVEETFRGDMSAGEGVARRETGEANAFIRQKRDEASMFIKVINMRHDTLMRVMRAIMLRQREFFMSDDPARLRPMILKDIAADTGDDISVISRATAGKYVATGQGVYPLKFFFTERHKESDDVSVQTVMRQLKEVIDAEDHDNPLTDAALTDILRAKGYDIARRTVAKYREKLGIPVGRLRHRI